MILTKPSTAITISLVLEDGNQTKYPQAQLLNSFGAAIGSPVNLTHGYDGTYVGTLTTPASNGVYPLHFVVFDDAGRTIESTLYGRDNDSLVVEQDLSEIENDVWKVLRSSIATPGSFGEAVKVIMGISAKSNMRLDNEVYDVNGFMTSARLRVFPDIATASTSTPGGSGEGEIFTVNITGTPDGVHICAPSTVLGLGS